MKKELWYLLINGQSDATTGLYGNFYSYGLHLGDALNNTFEIIAKEKFQNPNLIEAFKLDNFEVIEKNNELIKLSNDVYMREKIYPFSSDDVDKEFQPPVGITKSTGEDQYDYDLITENFVAYGQDENGIFELELVVGKAKLVEVFLKTIDFLPSIDGFWIYIQNHWCSKNTELWVAKHFINKEQVIHFLTEQENNTIKNGFIKLVVHSLEGETNLSLDDHKKIQLHTKDEEVFKHFIGQIKYLGYEQTRDFYNLEFGFQHWHYRLADSLNRTEFIEMLKDNQFEFIDAWDE